ncbi:MAG: cell division protein FtsH, partial [Spirochaetae bacterium HGW-Spirochaetae-6]
PLAYGKDDSPIFIGKEMGRYKDYSEETAHAIDVEMKKIVEEQYQVAQSIIHGNKESLEQMVKELLEKETLHLEDINRIIGLKPKAS